MALRPRSGHLRLSDLRGISRLAAEATRNVTRIVEGVHRSVLRTAGAPGYACGETSRGLTAAVYKSIHGITDLVDGGLAAALGALEGVLASESDPPAGSYQREAFLAALNGVTGDRLVSGNNPLAIPMSVRYRGEALDRELPPQMPDATGKVLLMIHGLCVNEQSWSVKSGGEEGGHAGVLASQLGYTPVYLRYNSGLHISENGRLLSEQLERLVKKWPVEVEELSILAHSMGGLLARSAVHEAGNSAVRWPKYLKNMVFLGVPHHGAPLEKAASLADAILGSTPWSAPFTRLGRVRSAGITDLRFGNVTDEDWREGDRFRRGPDLRQPVSLPKGVRCFAVAAITAARRQRVRDSLIGDGLVSVHSALGQHKDVKKSLGFPREAQHVAPRTNHMDLLRNPAVTRRIVSWLAPRSAQ